MNTENPVQIDLFGVSATRTKDTRLAEHIGGSRCGPHEGWPHSVTAGALLPGSYKVTRGQSAPTTVTARNASSARRLLGREAERFGMGTAVVLSQNLTEAAGPVRDGAGQIWQRVTGSWLTVTGKRREGDLLI